MWRDLEEEAIYIGLDLHYFWSLTPKQYAKHCKMFIKREDQEILSQDRLNHILGQYVGVAVTNGKEYPRVPFLTEKIEKKPIPQSVDDMERIARQNTLLMGGVINNDNRRTSSTDNG